MRCLLRRGTTFRRWNGNQFWRWGKDLRRPDACRSTVLWLFRHAYRHSGPSGAPGRWLDVNRIGRGRSRSRSSRRSYCAGRIARLWLWQDHNVVDEEVGKVNRRRQRVRKPHLAIDDEVEVMRAWMEVDSGRYGIFVLAGTTIEAKSAVVMARD
jgi:hypothetical protein